MKTIKTNNIRKVRFWGEQDGLPEGTLKSKLTELFHSSKEIDRAYLVRVSYEKSTEVSVALCLRGDHVSNANMAARVAGVFSQLFNQSEHLDILFLDDSQEFELQGISRPFFIKDLQ